MTTANGHNGQIEFDGSFVTIHRKGLRARGSVGKGDKRIPVTSITAVQWKPPGALWNGFIQFTMAGGVERRSRPGSQTTDAVTDENTVLITKKQEAEFVALRAAIEEAMVAAHAPHQVMAPQSDADELGKLAALRDQGILTESEFAAKKAQILGL